MYLLGCCTCASLGGFVFFASISLLVTLFLSGLISMLTLLPTGSVAMLSMVSPPSTVAIFTSPIAPAPVCPILRLYSSSAYSLHITLVVAPFLISGCCGTDRLRYYPHESRRGTEEPGREAVRDHVTPEILLHWLVPGMLDVLNCRAPSSHHSRTGQSPSFYTFLPPINWIWDQNYRTWISGMRDLDPKTRLSPGPEHAFGNLINVYVFTSTIYKQSQRADHVQFGRVNSQSDSKKTQVFIPIFM